MVKSGVVIAVFGTAALIEMGQPGGQCRRRLSFGRHLPQCNANTRPAMTIARDGRWPLPRQHCIDDPPLDGDNSGVAAGGHDFLKTQVARRIERPRFPQAIAGRMRRIDMRARYPPLRNRLGRWMGSAALQKLR